MVLKIEGRTVFITDGKMVVRITDCETQKAIVKAGVADCGIVTVQSYQRMIGGLFNNQIRVDVAHTRNLNHGDECCEVIVSQR